MKKLLVFLSALFLSASIYPQQRTALIKKVSATELKALIDSSTGPVVVNFWATWCAPCIREIPYMEAAIEKEFSHVKLLLVNLDYPSSSTYTMENFVKRKGYKNEVLHLNEKDPAYFLPLVEKKWSGLIPATMFVDNTKNYHRFIEMQVTPARFKLELQLLVD